jgi:HEAT repeat protein
MTLSARDFWTLGDYSRIAALIAAMGPAAQEAIPALREAEGDVNETVRAAATDALSKVGGKVFGFGDVRH